MAYTISLILIAIAAVVIFINQRALGTRKSYATIGGKGGAPMYFPSKNGKGPSPSPYSYSWHARCFCPSVS